MFSFPPVTCEMMFVKSNSNTYIKKETKLFPSEWLYTLNIENINSLNNAKENELNEKVCSLLALNVCSSCEFNFSSLPSSEILFKDVPDKYVELAANITPGEVISVNQNS